MANHRNHRQDHLTADRTAEHQAVRTAGQVILFWVLAGLAVAVFVPCVLVPMWVQSETVHRQAAQVQQILADKQARIDWNREVIAALRTDPLVNERLLRRELNYREDSERVVRWWTSAEEGGQVEGMPSLSHSSAPRESEQASIAEVAPPRWVSAMVRWMPDWPWRELFGQGPTRLMLLLMAGGLLASAFLLYGAPRTQAE